MKATVSITKNRKSVLVIEFNQEIPVFPESDRRWLNRGHKNLILHRRLHLETYAQFMANENQGAFQVELAGIPHEVYSDFLRDLVCIEGVIGVVAANRYELFVAFGSHFDHQVVAKKMASQIQKHFYPDESLEIETPVAFISSQCQKV